MAMHLTNVVKTEPFRIGDAAEAVRFDYFTLRDFNCPIVLFDHVRMRAAGFPPHPHAGFSVFSYIFEDSPGALRDRDSINPEILVEPGDILWFRMARGLIHEENPAVDGVEAAPGVLPLRDYTDGETAWGYRLAWEDPDGREAPYRGQGYIPYLEYVGELLDTARREGWGNIPYRDTF